MATTTIRIAGQVDPIEVVEDREVLAERLSLAGRGMQPTIKVTRASDNQEIDVGVNSITIVEEHTA